MKEFKDRSGRTIDEIKAAIEALGSYEICRVNDLPEQNGKGIVLYHSKTKARISLVLNDDDNKVFCIGFRTPADNSKGIQHIIEHTVLCGSKKYPVKDPFVELAKGSLNTFLNAMTYSDKTVYPVASCNDKDFSNLMDVYLDAVFNPNIYDREEIFKQEGWHYELTDMDGDITVNGVVYNEMRGVYSSPDSVLSAKINEVMFPDSVYRNDSGGNPDVIPELTREEYLDYHSKYYHPSNSFIYLYGDMDVVERLDYLDKEYLSYYDYLYVPSEIGLQSAFSSPVSDEVKYSVASSDELDHNAILSFNLIMGTNDDRYLNSAMGIIQNILIDNYGAPLKQKLIDSGICSDVESLYDSTVRQPMFSIVAREADAKDIDKFVSIIDESLREYVENGLDKKALESTINKMEFRAKEANFGRYPKGLAYLLSDFDGWLHDDNLAQETFTVKPLFDYLKEGINKNLLDPEDTSKGYFEAMIEKYILNNDHKSYITASPEIGLNQKKDDELKAKLQAMKDNMSEDELRELILDTENLKAYQAEPSTPEELMTIPLLSVEDIRKEVLPSKNRPIELSGISAVAHDLFTNGITYMDFYFDISDIPFDKLKKLGVIFDMLKHVDTDKHSFSELSTEANLCSGGMAFFTTCVRTVKGFKTYAVAAMKCLDDKLEDSLSLMKEIMLTSHIADKNRLKQNISSTLSNAKLDMVETGHITTRLRAASYIEPHVKIQDELSGIEYHRYLTYLDEHLDEDFDELADELMELYGNVFRKKALTVSYTSDLSDEAIEKALGTFKDGLSDAPVGEAIKDIPLEKKNEGFITSSKVQYDSLVANFMDAGLEYNGALSVLTTIMAYDYLWINVRVKGGAYGCMCDFNRFGHMFFTSYRDPNLTETYDIYRNAASYVENFECSDRDMTKYIIGTFAKSDAPLPASEHGVFSFNCYISGVTDEMRQKSRNESRNATVESIRALAPYIRLLSESDALSAIGSEEKLKGAADLFGSLDKLL